MLDLREILAKKEKGIERLRREISALARVISLLEKTQSVPHAADAVAKKSLAPRRNPAETSESGMAELELYYPFVGRNVERR